MLKLYEFSGAETDWVAASSEDEARDVLMRHYGIGPHDVSGSYESIGVVDGTSVEMLPDDWDYDDEDAVPPTAADVVAKMTKPGFVCSTYQ